MRWVADPASFERTVPPPRPGRRGRLRVLLAVLLVLGAGAAWFAAEPPATVSTTEPVTAPPAAPDTPATPGAPQVAQAPAAQEDDSDIQEDEAAPQASVPELLSGNTDLSFARRAGLHRAPNPLQMTASAAVAIDVETGEVLHARNAQEILPVASLTKLLTAMVLLDAGVPLTQQIVITDDDVDRLRNSRSRLRVGTRLSRGEALRLALMSSENRAAHALARTFPGGMDDFVRRMNLKAQQVGAVHASFVDPTGLSNANRASARDVAALVTAAAGYPQIRTHSTTSSHQARLGGQRLTYLNSNRLVRHDRWQMQVQKTGYIVEAGFCLATTMQVAGRRVALVLLDAGSRGQRDEDARRLRRALEARPAGR